MNKGNSTKRTRFDDSVEEGVRGKLWFDDRIEVLKRSMRYPPWIPIESSFDKFVYSLKGKRVSNSLTDSASWQKNADYFFDSPRVLLELKCFEKDLFNTEDDVERWQKFIADWEKQGLITGSDVIKSLFDGKRLPSECYRDLISACRRTIETAIKKARVQLSESRKIPGMEGAETIVLLANDGNYFLQHEGMFKLICNLMVTNFAEAPISGVVYFTVNMPAQIRGIDREMLCWLPAYGDDASDELVRFIDYLGQAWWAFYQALIQQEHYPATQIPGPSEEAQSTIRSMRHLRSRGRD
ncbi:MAG: hypothetical protein AB7W16_19015 [Candidatus Obscuribacterales bacterium]